MVSEKAISESGCVKESSHQIATFACREEQEKGIDVIALRDAGHVASLCTRGCWGSEGP